MRATGTLLPFQHSEEKRSGKALNSPLPAQHFAERIALW